MQKVKGVDAFTAYSFTDYMQICGQDVQKIKTARCFPCRIYQRACTFLDRQLRPFALGNRYAGAPDGHYVVFMCKRGTAYKLYSVTSDLVKSAHRQQNVFSKSGGELTRQGSGDWGWKIRLKTPRFSPSVAPFIITLGVKKGRLPHYYHIETGSNLFKSGENRANQISHIDTGKPRKTLIFRGFWAFLIWKIRFVNACWTAARDELPWDRTARVYGLENPWFSMVFQPSFKS